LTVWVSANALGALATAQPRAPILPEHERGLKMIGSLTDHHIV
jgi:hypothetical protein